MSTLDSYARSVGFQEFSVELMEFLEKNDVTLYGISIAPSKLRKLRHNIMKNGLGKLLE